MPLTHHLRTTGSALKNWFVAQTYDALCVGALWLIGLLILRVPLAPLWAFFGAVLQFVPNIGVVLALVGPALFALAFGGFEKLIYVLILYAVIALTDGFFLQPYLMRRNAQVPFWASLLTPIVLGILIPFWGVLLAPPLLAIFFAFRAQRRKAIPPPPSPPGARLPSVPQ